MNDHRDSDWFAGFTDGEGCFLLVRQSARNNGWQPHFTIALRVDDADVLYELQASFGGKIYVNDHPGGHPQVRWQVFRKADIAGLVRYFDTHPLRAKKRRDYLIWREAVGVYCAGSCHSPELVELHRALVVGRQFEASEQSPVVSEQIHQQLQVLDGGAM